VFAPIRSSLRRTGCSRAILVGHNAFFDLGFVKAAVERTGVKSPFHSFSSFDTATLGGLAYGQTVLARIAAAAGIEWDESQAHSAIYDAERTAELFCGIVNRWDELCRL
jgi:ribonuclease T